MSARLPPGPQIFFESALIAAPLDFLLWSVAAWCREDGRTYSGKWYQVFPGLANDLASSPISMILASFGGFFVLTGIVASVRCRRAAGRNRDDHNLANPALYRRYTAPARLTLHLSVALMTAAATVAAIPLMTRAASVPRVPDWMQLGSLPALTLPAIRISLALAILGFAVGAIVLASLRELRRKETAGEGDRLTGIL